MTSRKVVTMCGCINRNKNDIDTDEITSLQTNLDDHKSSKDGALRFSDKCFLSFWQVRVTTSKLLDSRLSFDMFQLVFKLGQRSFFFVNSALSKCRTFVTPHCWQSRNRIRKALLLSHTTLICNPRRHWLTVSPIIDHIRSKSKME